VVSSTAYSTDISDGLTVSALNGNALSFSVGSDGVRVNNARILKTDILTDNAVLHVIDRVILGEAQASLPADCARTGTTWGDFTCWPGCTGDHVQCCRQMCYSTAPSDSILQLVSGRSDMSVLASLLNSEDVPDAVRLALARSGELTLFAPTDAAFAAFLENNEVPSGQALVDVLLYHVLGASVPSSALQPLQFPQTLLTTEGAVNKNGEGQALKITADANGVMLYAGAGTAGEAASVTAADVMASNGVIHVIDAVLVPPPSTVDVATANGLTSLLGAVTSVDLGEAVQTTPGITIFAPLNSAFADLGDLSNVTPEDLSSILTGHVVPSLVYSTDLSDGLTARALNGADVVVELRADGAYISGAKVVASDVLTQNAVVHVIDTVITP